MQPLTLRRGQEILGHYYAGQPMQHGLLSVRPAYAGWTETIEDDNPHGIAPGVYRLDAAPPPAPPAPPPPLTDEEQREIMPIIDRVDFAHMLAGIRTAAWPAGILPSDVLAVIAAIPDRESRELTEWEFLNAKHFDRANPRVSSIGAALGLTDPEMDTRWLEFTNQDTEQ